MAKGGKKLGLYACGIGVSVCNRNMGKKGTTGMMELADTGLGWALPGHYKFRDDSPFAYKHYHHHLVLLGFFLGFLSHVGAKGKGKQWAIRHTYKLHLHTCWRYISLMKSKTLDSWSILVHFYIAFVQSSSFIINI